jgi:hypothetical protein
MKRGRSQVLAVLTAGSLLMLSSEAFAWQCTAKNVRGVLWFGAGATRAIAASRAINHCRINSGAPGSCVVIACVP